MGVTVTKNFGTLAGALQMSDRTLMREIGLLARERIVRRTISGESSKGTPFEPYSADYAALKRKELGGSGTVNLQVSGRMLNGLVIVDISETSVTLGFKD